MPFYFLRPNPFPLYDIIQEKQAYKYHLKHPDAFIFLIADYEGFWVIKNSRLYKLKNNTLKNANQFFYMSGEEYIRDIASGDGMRVGYRYKGCFNANDAQYWSKQGNNIFIKLINQK
jgi:hypothetical protein